MRRNLILLFVAANVLLCLGVFRDALWGKSLLAPVHILPATCSNCLLDKQPFELENSPSHERIPFDREALTLTPPETRRLLVGNGFAVISTDFQFIFPNLLRWLRSLKAPIHQLPFSAQHPVL